MTIAEFFETWGNVKLTIVRDRTTENKIRLSANAFRDEYDYYVSSINIDSEKDMEYGIEQLHNQFVSQIQEQIELANKRISLLKSLWRSENDSHCNDRQDT